MYKNHLLNINQNHNFLEKLNNQTLIPTIISIATGLLYIGYIFGVSTTDSKNVELRQENKELIKTNKLQADSLIIFRTDFKTTDKKAN